MKKRIALILTVLVILLSACSTKEERDSHSYDENVRLGEMKYDSKEYELAASAFEGALTVNPHGYDAYIGLIRTYLALEDDQKGTEILLKALEHKSEDADFARQLDQFTLEDQGNCGDELTYELRSFGLLIISGTGTMDDMLEYCPWRGESIKHVILPDGLEAIGDCAFLGDDFSSIELPGSLKRIGIQAFSGSSLKELIIPEGVTEIGNYAFQACEDLESVALPTSLEKLGDGVFECCTELEEISLASTNRYFACVDDVLFSYDLTELIAYPAGNGGREYAVPDGVCTIRNGAFSGAKRLRSVSLPYGVAEICRNAFEQSGLESIEIPGTVKIIDSDAFFECESLESVTLHEGIEILDGGFRSCPKLKTVTLPASLWYTNGDFWSCESLESIIVDGNNSYFKSEDGVLFSKDGKLLVKYPEGKQGDFYRIPEGTTELYTGSFTECHFLKDLVIPSSVTTIPVIPFMLSSVSTIYYTGSESQWNSYFSDLMVDDDITIHYDYPY